MSKYASLPDLDSSPDIYETPDLVTSPTATSPPSPRSPPYSSTAIDRTPLQPSSARVTFHSHTLDASDVDFSDRISTKRKSYKAGRKDEDDDDDQSPAAKLAKAWKLIDEIRDEAGEDEELSREVNEVCKVMDRLAVRRKVRESSVTPEPKGEEGGHGVKSQVKETADDTSTAMATAELESRLSALESLLGLTTIQASTTATSLTPVLPLLAKLSTQIQTLTNTSTPVLDAANRKVKALLNDAEKLADAQKRARAAGSSTSLLNNALEPGVEGGSVQASSQLEKEKEKINALFGTLNTIDTLSPLLPGILDRLRTLRGIHANAGEASKRLEEVERKVDGMEGELVKWKEVLERAKEIVRDAEERIEKNAEVVEGWVKSVEDKIDSLEDEADR